MKAEPSFSVPKVIILGSGNGLVLAIVEGLFPEIIRINGSAYKMAPIIKVILPMIILPTIVALYTTGKLEWLRKSDDKST